MPSLPVWRQLAPASEAQRRNLAAIGRADIADALRFVETLSGVGRSVDLQGRRVNITGKRARGFWLGGGQFVWDRADAIYRNAETGRIIAEATVKAGAETVIANSRASVATLYNSLREQEITLGDWEAGMQAAAKRGLLAQIGLAHGGIDQIPVSALQRGEARLFEQFNGTADWVPGTTAKGQFPGLRRFAEDIARGRYGSDQLSQSAASRALSYSEAGRVVYENEILYARRDVGHDEAAALLASVEHCEDCINRAAMGWIPLEEMLSNYPLGSSACGARCYCLTVTRRSGQEDGPAVRAAIEKARSLT